MSEQVSQFLVSLSEFLLFFVVAAVLTIVFIGVYTRVTKHNEIALIKKNSTAAAAAFSGSLIGFALPLASTTRLMKNPWFGRRPCSRNDFITPVTNRIFPAWGVHFTARQ